MCGLSGGDVQWEVVTQAMQSGSWRHGGENRNHQMEVKTEEVDRR